MSLLFRVAVAQDDKTFYLLLLMLPLLSALGSVLSQDQRARGITIPIVPPLRTDTT
jgi:hypothetical protein